MIKKFKGIALLSVLALAVLSLAACSGNNQAVAAIPVNAAQTPNSSNEIRQPTPVSSDIDDIWAFPVDNLISTDTITPAVISESGDVQEITVTLSSDGFSPGVIVLQDGIDFVINFEFDGAVDESDPYNGYVYFSEYGLLVDMFDDPQTPPLPAIAWFVEDFSFEDGYGERRGFVKVVEDLSNFDIDAVIAEAEAYQVPIGGASCH